MGKFPEPNYEYWCKMDEWPFKDAALLLNGLDPLEYRPVKFNLNEVPAAPELNVNWRGILTPYWRLKLTPPC